MIEIPESTLALARTGKHLQLLCRGKDICISERTARRRLHEYRRLAVESTETALESTKTKKITSDTSGVIHSPERLRIDLRGKHKVYVFTSAQTGTSVHPDFWRSLTEYVQERNACLLIGGLKYGTSGYCEEVRPYIHAYSALIADDLIWNGEVSLLPTAGDPLSGLDSYCIGKSGIFPHTKVRLKSLPCLDGEEPRIQYTTGTVTMRNYSESKAGNKASFHHVYGALVVEFDDDGNWFARQLVADADGCFYDLNRRFTPHGFDFAAINTLTFGDVHFPREHPAFWTWLSTIENYLQPTNVVLHDVYDFFIRNHHNKDKLLHNIDKGSIPVHHEFNLFIKSLVKVWENTDANIIIVASNHDEAFDRWLTTTHPLHDPINAAFIASCLNTGLQYGTPERFFPIVVAHSWPWVDLPLRIRMLHPGSSFTTFNTTGKPIEHGVHGHQGINGSQGSPIQFTKIGKRINLGHTHTAQIIDGVYCAGTSTKLRMGYNIGPSTWSHSHIITYSNGKRTIITCRGEKWKA